MMLAALSSDREVGVDLEALSRGRGVDAIARQFFTDGERSALEENPSEKEDSFLRLWTAKESVLKARGEGLALGPERAEVSLGRNRAPRLVRLAGDERAAAGWSLDVWNPIPGAVACLAAEGNGWKRVDRGNFL
jgi:4'-phosphopantetheinyl transferase